MLENKCYKIKCITNLHVGDGDANYNIIDNEIERDPVNNYPIIFSTGVKGALREHFVAYKSEDIDIIFGKEGKNKKGEENEKGNIKFTNAYLLALPMRASRGEKSYYMVTSVGMLMQLIDLESMLRPQHYDNIQEIKNEINKIKEPQKISEEKIIAVEGIENIKSNVKETLKSFINKWIKEDIVILPEYNFRNYLYPVRARNKLINGKSDNLWYEEFVPHNSMFYFYTIEMSGEKGRTAFDKFVDGIKNNNLVQFGGNSSVGFGLTKLEEVIINGGKK